MFRTNGLHFRAEVQEQLLTDSDDHDTESPGSSLDIGNTNSLDIYGITPPSNQRETKRNKEKIKSHKSKKANQEFKECLDVRRREKQRDAKRQEAAIQNMREDMASCKLDDEEEVLLDVSQTERQIKRKDSSKAFKTSRGYERDFKRNSSGDLAIEISPAEIVRIQSSIKVDSPNRYYSLNSKQVPGVSEDATGIELSVQQRRKIPSHYTECPSDRSEFYRIFSQLINMGSEKKKDKEVLQRQLSSEQLVWQNRVNDLIWLELQAWYRDVSIEEQDHYLIATREGAINILNEVMDFHVDLNSDKVNTNCDTLEAGSPEFGRHPSIDIGRAYASQQITDLSEIVKRHREAMHQVSDILGKLETVEKLYPTLKAMGHDHPVCATVPFQMRISTLHLWLNLSKDLGHKLQLMAKVLFIDQIPDAEWPWLDIDSPNSVDEESPSECLAEEEEDSVDGIGNDHIQTEKENPADSGISTLLDHEKKSVRFDIGSSSDASSPSDSQNVPGVSLSPPSDSSTPQRAVRSLSHTSHSSTMSRSNSSMSMEELTHLSIYRYYADRYKTYLTALYEFRINLLGYSC